MTWGRSIRQVAKRASTDSQPREGALVMRCRLPDFETEPDSNSYVRPEMAVLKCVVSEHDFNRKPVRSERNNHRGGLEAAAGLILKGSCKDAEVREIEFSLQHCGSPVDTDGA